MANESTTDPRAFEQARYSTIQTKSRDEGSPNDAVRMCTVNSQSSVIDLGGSLEDSMDEDHQASTTHATDLLLGVAREPTPRVHRKSVSGRVKPPENREVTPLCEGKRLNLQWK